MSLTSFSFPTPTLFRPDSLAELPRRLSSLGIARPLVVTDSGLVKTCAFRVLRNVLGSEDENVRWFLYSGVHPNPIEQDVREGAEAFRKGKCDSVIAIGGGSAL